MESDVPGVNAWTSFGFGISSDLREPIYLLFLIEVFILAEAFSSVLPLAHYSPPSASLKDCIYSHFPVSISIFHSLTYHSYIINAAANPPILLHEVFSTDLSWCASLIRCRDTYVCVPTPRCKYILFDALRKFIFLFA